jgi:hypothetical protein
MAMVILKFVHEGWDVATSSWTAASNTSEHITVCYEWGPDRMSVSGAVSTARINFKIGMPAFMTKVREAIHLGTGIVDLSAVPVA